MFHFRKKIIWIHTYWLKGWSLQAIQRKVQLCGGQQFHGSHSCQLGCCEWLYYGGGPGPDIDNLHFDCHQGKGSLWNKKAIKLIADELMNRVDEDLDRKLPVLLYDSVQELVWNRFQCLMVVWQDAQTKTGIDGMEEHPDELEMYLNESRDIELKTYQHFNRRNSVSVSFCDQYMELPNRTTQKYWWRKRVVDWQVEFRELWGIWSRGLGGNLTTQNTCHRGENLHWRWWISLTE